MSERRSLLVLVVFVLVGLAVLLALGTWQIERKAWKEALIATLTERLSATPVELPPPPEWGKLTPQSSEFLRVKLRPDFVAGDALAYTSGSALRDDVKSPGYFVFAAGRLPSGRSVVVNRGYVKDRTYPVRTGPEEIVGYLRWPERSSWVVADHDASADVWHVRDHRLMAGKRGWGEVAPFYVEQESPVPPGGVPHPAPLQVNLPNHHLQYALTWYGLAAVLVAMFAVWMHNRRRQMSTRSDVGV
jgi:cytochrome oxidase assembly protein ShyY1